MRVSASALPSDEERLMAFRPRRVFDMRYVWGPGHRLKILCNCFRWGASRSAPQAVESKQSSFPERRVFKQAEPIALRVANVLRDRSVQVFVPGCVLIYKAIGLRFVALILHF